MCAALRSLDHAQRLRGRPDVVPADLYIIALMAAWHPLLWCCCGGGWGAVLGACCAEALAIVVCPRGFDQQQTLLQQRA